MSVSGLGSLCGRRNEDILVDNYSGVFENSTPELHKLLSSNTGMKRCSVSI